MKHVEHEEGNFVMKKKNNWILARIGNALFTAILAILVMATLTGFTIREGNWFMFSLPKHSLNGVTFRTELDVYSQDTENILVFLDGEACPLKTDSYTRCRRCDLLSDAGFLLIANMPRVISLSGFSCYIPK